MPALAAAATVAGMRSFVAIAGWVADVPGCLLDSRYARCGEPDAAAPSKTTIWRMVTAADADAVDVAVTGWLADRDPAPAEGVHVVGKTQRGAIDADGDQVHLLAAVTDTSVVLAQDDVAAKTNEITGFAPLLDRLRVAGRTVTADALHTQRGHAEYQHGRNAKFVFCVKGNQPRLFDAPDVLPWETAPTGHESTERGHGRFTRRTICVLPAPEDLPFPGCGALSAAKLVAETGRPDRFTSGAAFATFSSTAPIPASSGASHRQRLNRGGNRQVNAAIHRIAITQSWMYEPATNYLARRRSQGDSSREAYRALKRHIARKVYTLLMHDFAISNSTAPSSGELPSSA
ncbi:putative transposase YbfD/YdcC [Catenulispora sp. MAP12-49]|uniref:ISAs1 family transposase n=1 Tax=Catenulispora sp. MAP12-49 TaxID=3156302 RepID=UPI003513CF8F